jgi:hypothetical protein
MHENQYRFDPSGQNYKELNIEQMKPIVLESLAPNPMEEYIKTVIFEKIEDITNRVESLSSRLSSIMTPAVGETRFTPIQIGELRPTSPSPMRLNLHETVDRLRALEEKLNIIIERIDL